MKRLLFIIPLFIQIGVFGQEGPITIPAEAIEVIRTDIWKPFMEAYRDLDSKKLMSIHTSDVLRVTIDENKVETGTTYLESFGGFLERVKERGSQVSIAFAILSTAIDETGYMAYQTGYYRFSSGRRDENNLQVRGYGYFNVALRKENGKWKISMDSDKGADIDEATFRASDMVYELTN